MKIVAVAVFLIVILLIITERVHRTAAAMAGAMVLILTGVMSADKALSYIDFNTIGVLVGMMIFVAIVRRSGMFEYIAVRAAKAVHGDPWKIMVAFTLITAVLSAILDNVTTVLLVGPMSIAIARMLLKNAPIVILDEATAFTDLEHEDKIQRSIAALTKGKTLLVIAHRLSTIQNADNIVVLRNGAIEAQGKQAELLETCPLYREMWLAHIGAKDWAVSAAEKEA